MTVHLLFFILKRTGTPAAVMENQISEDVMKDRFDRLLEEVQTIGREVSVQRYRKCTGSTGRRGK